MKIYLNNDKNKGWIFSNIVADYHHMTRHEIVGPDKADALWFLNPWMFQLLACDKPHYISIHHIDETKLDEWNFNYIRRHATGCFVPNDITEKAVKQYVGIPTYKIPYWLRSGVYSVPVDDMLKKRLSPNGEILIGSFQKDSEGMTNKPKMSKGPDRFLDIVVELRKNYNVKVILAGYSRGFLINGLIKHNIPYEYFENTPLINELYSCLDWYFVTSRVEGGPQSVLEASCHNVKILSYPVGMSKDVLHPDCICNSNQEFCERFVALPDLTLKYNADRVFNDFKCVDIVDKIDSLLLTNS